MSSERRVESETGAQGAVDGHDDTGTDGSDAEAEFAAAVPLPPMEGHTAHVCCVKIVAGVAAPGAGGFSAHLGLPMRESCFATEGAAIVGVIAASHDGTVSVWRINDDETDGADEFNPSDIHCDRVASLSVPVDPDPSEVVSDAQAAAREKAKFLHGVVLSRDLRTIVVAAASGEVHVWRDRSAAADAVTRTDAGRPIFRAAREWQPEFLFLGSLQVCGDEVGELVLWEGPASPAAASGAAGDGAAAGPPTTVARIYCCGQDHTCPVLDATDCFRSGDVMPRVLTVLRGHTDEVLDVTVSPDGRHVFTLSWSQDRSIRVWRTDIGDTVAPKGDGGARFDPDVAWAQVGRFKYSEGADADVCSIGTWAPFMWLGPLGLVGIKVRAGELAAEIEDRSKAFELMERYSSAAMEVMMSWGGPGTDPGVTAASLGDSGPDPLHMRRDTDTFFVIACDTTGAAHVSITLERPGATKDDCYQLIPCAAFPTVPRLADAAEEGAALPCGLAVLAYPGSQTFGVKTHVGLNTFFGMGHEPFTYWDGPAPSARQGGRGDVVVAPEGGGEDPVSSDSEDDEPTTYENAGDYAGFLVVTGHHNRVLARVLMPRGDEEDDEGEGGQEAEAGSAAPSGGAEGAPAPAVTEL